MASRTPSTWEEYERGASPRSVSIDSNAITEDQSLLEDHDTDFNGDRRGSSPYGGLRQRRRCVHYIILLVAIKALRLHLVCPTNRLIYPCF